MEDARLSRIDTLWSVVQRAHSGQEDAVEAAQRALLERYGGAVRRYALAALRDEDAADEVFQEFALRFVRGDFGRADPNRGRFRSYVKSAVFRLIVDHQRRQQRRRQESPHLTNLAESTTGEIDGDALFHASWREELLARSWDRLRADEAETGKPYYTILLLRAAEPALRSEQLAERLSESLGKPMSSGAVRVLLHRSRDKFADFLLDEVMESLAGGTLEAAEEELIDLELIEYCRGALERRRTGA
jgi:RNA polymerase sigma-70 factor (ECF subfamily)